VLIRELFLNKCYTKFHKNPTNVQSLLLVHIRNEVRIKSLYKMLFIFVKNAYNIEFGTEWLCFVKLAHIFGTQPPGFCCNISKRLWGGCVVSQALHDSLFHAIVSFM
jgi:hypothetical protein